MALYDAKDILATYRQSHLDELVSLQRTFASPSSVDAAWILPRTFELMYGPIEPWYELGLQVLPVAVYGVIPICTLPAAILSYMTARTPSSKLNGVSVASLSP